MLSDVLMCCRVCGYEYDSPPWGSDGMTPIFEICPCCGVEYGYEDATLTGIKKYRHQWINDGCKWNDPDQRPSDWSYETQIINVPEQFR